MEQGLPTLYSQHQLPHFDVFVISDLVNIDVFIAITKSVDQKVVYSNPTKKIANYFFLFLGNGTETIPKHQYIFEYKLKISISLGDIILNRNAEMCIIEREPIIYMFYVDR